MILLLFWKLGEKIRLLIENEKEVASFNSSPWPVSFFQHILDLALRLDLN
jgi:hypothetical protein